MAVDAVINNAAAAVPAKPAENKPIHAEPVITAALGNGAAGKEVQGSTPQSNTEQGGNIEKKDGQADKKQIESAVSHVNSKIRKTGCQFSYHEETKRVSIKVIDKETEEVIKEIPPEETLEMVEKMWELAGILVDEKG